MTAKAELPVVFLAFANAMDDHLATLKQESRDVFRILQPLQREERLAIHREESSEFDELYQDLLAYNDRIVIFHYGGHADGTMLQLEGGAGSASGIAALLGQQSSLKLVFLNGCATKDQVKLLHGAGVPAVIATAVKVNDTRATQFSTAFYSALATGQSIFEAFDSASNFLEGKLGDAVDVVINRSPNYDFAEAAAASDVLEWSLYVKQQAAADLRDWRLPEAREGWQTQLEDRRGAIRGLDGEPLPIAHRHRSRSAAALLCSRCGTTTASSGADQTVCPVCGSNDTQTGVAQTAIPDLVVPATVTEQDARAIVATVLGDVDPASVQLHQINLPYWLFDVHTHTSLSAERGLVRTFDADLPQVEWEPVREDIVLRLDAHLVAAGKAPVGRSAASADWHWQLDDATTLQQLESAALFVPLDVSIEAGFEQVTDYIAGELEAEVSDRVGGHQQRNVVADIRYKKVSAGTVLLPHWYATVSRENGSASMLINGQTGAVRFPRIPGMAALKESEINMSQKIFEPGGRTEKASLAISAFSGVGIGTMVGLLLGLAAPAGPWAKTTVSIFIGAVGVGLAALLGLNDRHFSNAKGLRIGAFGLTVAVAGLAGIYVRDHGLMSPSLEARAEEVRSVFKGSDDQDVMRILAAGDASPAAGVSGTAGNGANSVGRIELRSLMYSAPAADQDVCDKLSNMRDDEVGTDLVLSNFRDYDEDGELGWTALADQAEQQVPQDDLKGFLLVSRDLICGTEPFERRMAVDQERCARLAQAQTDALDWRAWFSSTEGSAAVLEVLDQRLSAPGADSALPLLGPMLCAADKTRN